MHRLNFNHLYYFYVIAQLGSIKAASSKLHLTPSTLSDQLKSLEVDFGVKLFDRLNKKLVLNKHGKVVLSYAEKIFKLSDELQSAVSGTNNSDFYDFGIGLPPLLEKHISSELFLPITQKENIFIRVIESEKGHLMEMLLNRELDLVISDNCEDLPESVVALDISSSRTFIAGSRKYAPLLNNEKQSVADLPFVDFASRSRFKYQLDLHYRSIDFKRTVIAETDDIDLMILLLKQGRAIAAIPEGLIKRFTLNSEIFVLREIEAIKNEIFALVSQNSDIYIKKTIKEAIALYKDRFKISPHIRQEQIII